jgi:hypothetical protein
MDVCNLRDTNRLALAGCAKRNS